MNRYLSAFLLLFLGGGLSGQSASVEAVLDAVRADSLMAVVRQFTGEEAVIVQGQTDTIHSRYISEPGNELAFLFAKQKLESYGWQVEEFPFGLIGGKNLIATLPGTTHPEKMVMLGAHYDNLPPMADAPGADDNASGCATVLETARVLAGQQFPFTIVLALWDEEEQGTVGSSAYTGHLAANNAAMDAYINLDMLAWDSDSDYLAEVQVRNIANSSALAQKAVWADSIYEIELEINVINPGVTNSDHGSFWEEWMTAINLSESFFTDFNPHYHSDSDALAHFNVPYFEKLAKLSIATLLEYGFELATGAVSTDETTDLPVFQLYPNPAHGFLRIKNQGSSLGGSFQWRIMNALGQPVLEGICETPEKTIAIAGLPQGIYRFIVANQHGKTAYQTFLKI